MTCPDVGPLERICGFYALTSEHSTKTKSDSDMATDLFCSILCASYSTLMSEDGPFLGYHTISPPMLNLEDMQELSCQQLRSGGIFQEKHWGHLRRDRARSQNSQLTLA
eukprot:4734599-Amphidinium_carterae.2